MKEKSVIISKKVVAKCLVTDKTLQKTQTKVIICKKFVGQACDYLDPYIQKVWHKSNSVYKNFAENVLLLR